MDGGELGKGDGRGTDLDLEVMMMSVGLGFGFRQLVEMSDGLAGRIGLIVWGLGVVFSFPLIWIEGCVFGVVARLC